MVTVTMVSRRHRPSLPSEEHGSQRSEAETISWVEHYSCALGGLGAVVGAFVLFGHLLTSAAAEFEVFALTVLVFVLVALWVVVWIGLEFVWEWRAGRLKA